MAWGEGRVFKRGHIYWISYYCGGREVRESSKSEHLKVARGLLHERVANSRTGLLAPREAVLVYDELEADIIRDYQINQRRSIFSLTAAQKHLRSFFHGIRIVRLNTSLIREYILHRKGENAANATINRELSALRRMFHLAQDANRVGRLPFIPMLTERNARQGFFDHATFINLRSKLPADLARTITFLYLSGWRLGEARNLQWRDVDWQGQTIMLRHENSKNGRPRTLALRGELLATVAEARKHRKLECLYVFHHDAAPMDPNYIYKHWKAACKAAGQRGKLIHDLRRTAIRNMVRAGVPTNIIMAQSGHLTSSVFRRYDIVSEEDLGTAQDRLAAYLASQTTPVAAHEV